VTGWTTDELRRLEAAQEIEIAPERRNGRLRRRTPIWVVRAGDDLYVRAAYGRGSGWHNVARTSRKARIWAAGVEKDVTIEDADDETVLDRVDAAYRQKYGGRYASIVDSINDDEHRATTLRLTPREAG
jgi:hypothetical protein